MGRGRGLIMLGLPKAGGKTPGPKNSAELSVSVRTSFSSWRILDILLYGYCLGSSISTATNNLPQQNSKLHSSQEFYLSVHAT